VDFHDADRDTTIENRRSSPTAAKPSDAMGGAHVLTGRIDDARKVTHAC
jgi:hypothetical protein